MSVELKIKSKHLALEPQIIKKEEKKLAKAVSYYNEKINEDNLNDHSLFYKSLYKMNSLTLHRKWNVRNEARATYLAIAYLKGKPYSSVENPDTTDMGKLYAYIVPRVVKMVSKYGPNKIVASDVNSWIEG